MATRDTPWWSLWVAFDLLGLALFITAFLDRRPKLILDDRGILDKRLRIGVIPWAEIRSVDVRSLGGVNFIWLKRSETGSENPSGKALPLRADDLDVPAPVLAGLILERWHLCTGVEKVGA